MKSAHFLENNSFFTRLWLIFHLVIALSFALGAFFGGGVKFDADFMNMMPENEKSKAVRVADKALFSTASKNVFLLVANEDFSKAKKAAEDIFASLNAQSERDKFDSISLSADISSMEDIRDFVKEWKWNFISKENRERIAQSPEAFAFTALERASGFTIGGLDDIESDPFMLEDAVLEDYLGAISDSGIAMSAKDGVLASEYEGVWYVMIRAVLSEKGERLLSRENAVPLLEKVAKESEKDGTRVVFYGTPFHSYNASTSAQREITIISTICTIALLVLLVFTFKSAKPILFSLFSVAISVLTALFATHAIFGSVHTLTLVFGTSLLGSSIDYSLHFFINWKNGSLKSGSEIRRKLFAPLSLSLFSTEICYALLLFAPFALVKQMAVFSFCGIMSTFLTSISIFPLLSVPSEKQAPSTRLFCLHNAKMKIALKVLLASLCAITTALNAGSVKMKNNISALYKMDGKLKDDTILAYKILRYNPTNFFIVSAKSAQEVLEKEERLASRIEGGCTATSRFVSSVKAQKEAKGDAKALLPYVGALHEYLGFSGESSQKVIEDCQSDKFFRIEDDFEELPATLKSVLGALWIGKVGKEFYSVVIPSKIEDEGMMKKIANSESGVYFESKVESVSSSLDELTLFIVKIFLISFAIIFVVLRFFYSWRDTIKIATVPILSIGAIVSLFALLKQSLEFFSVIGMVLVFGLGLDYIIYATQKNESEDEKEAITLSFLTTAISFGSLALSSFVPVHVLGLSILTGLSAAFICTIL